MYTGIQTASSSLKIARLSPKDDARLTSPPLSICVREFTNQPPTGPARETNALLLQPQPLLFFFLFSMKVLNPLYALHFIAICGLGPGRQDQILLEPHPSWRGWFYSLNVKATSPRFFLSLFCACKKLCEVRSWDSNLSSHSNCVRRRVYVVFPGNAETLLLP